MKNSLNLGFVVLLFVILGCSCPRLNDFKLSENRSESPTPNSTPFTTNTTPTPTKTGNGNITLAKYNQIKNEMKYSDAVAILGEEGTQVSTSESGSYKIATYKWDGENYSYIILTFTNDRLKFKSQANLK